jgi:hypothetical protein
MTRHLTLSAAAVVVLTACGSTSQSTPPGSPAVYTQIAQSTSCSELQALFDIAEANNQQAMQPPIDQAELDWTLSYMTAAGQRMEDLGC